MKVNVFLTSLFLSTAILGVSSQAMIQEDEDDFKNLSQCFDQFRGVNRTDPSRPLA